MLRELWSIQPRLHVFGHVHAGRGQSVVHWDAAQKAYEASMARSDGLARGMVDVKLWLNLARMVVYGTLSLIWDRGWGGEGVSTQLINASLMYNNTGQLRNEAQIVDI